MEYKFKEYERVIDTPNGKLEERAIVEKIMSLLNNNKFSSLEDFYEANKDFNEFKKNNNLNVVLKHFGEKLKQEDYEKIIASLRKLTEKKSSFDKEGIETKNVSGKEYVTYEGKDEKYYFDNSYSFESFDKQLENLQKENSDFQTSDTKENTENMMKEMKENKKITLILRYLNEINYEVLNQQQQKLFKFVFDYQQKNSGLIRVDLDEKVMVDDNENIMKIEEIDGNLTIVNSYNEYNLDQKDLQQDINIKEKELSFAKMPKKQLFEEE